MAARSIASLSLTFGLVSIPIKLYSATESSAAIRFKLMSASGARIKQQYVADVPAAEQDAATEELEEQEERERDRAAKEFSTASKVVDLHTPRREIASPAYAMSPPVSPASTVSAPDHEQVVERSSIVKGYEFEKGKFVLFTAEELKALEAGSRKTIDIVSFIPENAVDPIYYNKAYFLAPDKRGSKPYSLLLRAMRDTGRCALAKWAFRSKEYVAQIRAADDGMVLQQLFYAEEVRSLASLHIEPTDVGDAELNLAKKLIEHISAPSYDPTEFVDEEKKRILAAVEEKIAGKRIASPTNAPAAGGEVVDLLKALQASLQGSPGIGGKSHRAKPAFVERKPSKRATSKLALVPAAPSKGRSTKR